MMAIAKYIVVRVFEYEGKDTMLGQELVLKDSEGESLVQKGKLKLLSYLDPEDEGDKAVIDATKEKAREDHKETVEADEARDVATNDNLLAEEQKKEEEIEEQEEDESALPAVEEKMKREDLEAIAREEGFSDEQIVEATTKAALVDIIEKNRLAE